MPTAPSFDDLIAQHEGEALSVRPTLKFREGDVTLAQEHGAAAMADASIRYTAQAFKETFIDGAEGDQLTGLVDDRYNIQRNPATAATVDVSVTRTGGGIAGNLPAGFVVASTFDLAGNTVLYTLNAPAIFAGGDNGPHVVSATAEVLGKSGNVAAGKVTRVVGVPFDALIAVTNPLAAAGGNEEESDPELRDRARNFWVTLRRGTLAALEFGARQVSSVRVSKATENINGDVTLVVADSDGNSTLQMVSDVVTEIENWRAAGCLVSILGGTQLLVPISAQIIFRKNSGADVLVYAPLCAAAITSRMAKFKQGEIGYLDAIKAAAIAVDPDVIEALIFSSPTTDITPTVTQTIRAGVITLI